jgi:hypothetical protein
MTDGVSAGIDRYGVPADWPAFVLASRDPADLIDTVHARRGQRLLRRPSFDMR